MAQKIINVGSAANDGTGDSLRTAFQNVNNNFTEVYSNVGNLSATLVSVYTQSNTSNAVANNIGAVANAWSNTYAATVGASANSYAGYMANSSNALTISVASSGNSYLAIVAAAINNSVSLGQTGGNAYSVTVGASSNAYTNTVSASDRAYTNASTLAANNWAAATLQTIANTSSIYGVANQAFSLANTALQNVSTTLAGSLTSTGFYTDVLGPVREKRTLTVNSNTSIVASETVIIANNSNGIYINIENDGNFVLGANLGTTVEIYQHGSGPTTIRPNTSVTLKSANSWTNVAGQYLVVSLVKVLANTWILTGDLKA